MQTKGGAKWANLGLETCWIVTQLTQAQTKAQPKIKMV